MRNVEAIQLIIVLQNIERSGRDYNGGIWYGVTMSLAKLELFNSSFVATRNKISQKYVKTDKDGKFKMKKGGEKFEYKAPDGEKKHLDEINKIAQKEVEIELQKIDFEDVKEEKFGGIENISSFFKHLVQNGKT